MPEQVTMALYEDPPHQHHLPSILPGTQLPEKILTAADRPRQETLWCERHDERMRERRNGGGQYGPPGHYASVVRPFLSMIRISSWSDALHIIPCLSKLVLMRSMGSQSIPFPGPPLLLLASKPTGSGLHNDSSDV